MPAGLGWGPLGSFSLGAFAPDQAEPVPITTGARFVDERGDYQLDADGQHRRMPPLRQRILLALRARRGSSSVLPEMGITIPPTVSGQFESEIRSAVTTALAPIVESGDMVITRVRVESVNAGRSVTVIEYRDTAQGTDEEERVLT